MVQAQTISLAAEVVAGTGCRMGADERAISHKGTGRLNVVAIACDLINSLARRGIPGLLQVVALVVVEHPLHRVVRQFGLHVTCQCDGGLQDIVHVSRGGDTLLTLHVGTVDTGICQCHVWCEVAQRVAHHLVLCLALHAEEPQTGLIPLDVDGFVVAVLIVIFHPLPAAVVDLVGTASQQEHVAMSGLQVHIGEVEGGTLVLTEADAVNAAGSREVRFGMTQLPDFLRIEVLAILHDTGLQHGTCAVVII